MHGILMEVRSTNANKRRLDLDLSFPTFRLGNFFNSNVFDTVISRSSHYEFLITPFAAFLGSLICFRFSARSITSSVAVALIPFILVLSHDTRDVVGRSLLPIIIMVLLSSECGSFPCRMTMLRGMPIAVPPFSDFAP